MNPLKGILTGILKSFNYKKASKQDASKNAEPVFMALEEARLDTAIVREMHKQMNDAKLTIGSGDKYIAGLKFKGSQYYILGTQKEWQLFFGMDRSTKM